MSVRLFEKPLKPFKVISVTGACCVCEADDGVRFTLKPGDKVTVEHRISVGGPEFLMDKRSLKAFVQGLKSVGFYEKELQ